MHVMHFSYAINSSGCGHDYELIHHLATGVLA